MPDEKKLLLRWTGDRGFTGARPDGPTFVLDGRGAVGPSPMEALLAAAAGCSAIDVVSILEKMRQPLAALSVDATGVRRDEEPRRFMAVRLVFHASGAGLDDAKVRRAVGLSVEKYCSVLSTFAPDVTLEWDVVID